MKNLFLIICLFFVSACLDTNLPVANSFDAGVLISSDESFIPVEGNIEGNLGFFTDVDAGMNNIQIIDNGLTVFAEHSTGQVMVQFDFVDDFSSHFTKYPTNLSYLDNFVGIGCQGNTKDYWDVDNPIEDGTIIIAPVGSREWQIDFFTEYRTSANQEYQYLSGSIIVKE
jgi:hypothetical protein